MSKKFALILSSFLLLVIASGCVKNCKPEDYDNFLTIADSPSEGSVISYNNVPAFSWHNNIGCKPKKYRIFVDNQYSGDVFVLDMDGDQSELTSADILEVFEPNRDMAWYIVAFGEYPIGPFQSELIHFRTDGQCEANELVPPNLFTPENEAWLKLSNGSVWLGWEHPGTCVPEYFRYELAVDPEFSAIIGSGKATFMNFIDQDGNNPAKVVSGTQIQVPDCARIYWRAEARVGNNSGGLSEVFRFTNASDYNCWQNEVSIDAALIKGYVFEDICDYSKPFDSESNEILPPCASSEYGIHADGIWEKYDASEPGISDIWVDLGAGPCPSSGLDQSRTMSNGMYYFLVQAPGEYCVSVNKQNNPSLGDGIWTRPLTDQDVTQQTLLFGQNDKILTQDFGWDDNNFIKLNFNVSKLTTCRKTDNKNSRPVMYLEEGAIVPIIASNEQNTWFLTLFDCFVSVATGEPEPGDLPLYPEQPHPELQPIPVSDSDPEPEIDCSDFASPRSCPDHQCIWVVPAGAPGSCKEQ